MCLELHLIRSMNLSHECVSIRVLETHKSSFLLNHWGRLTHAAVNQTIINSDNGLPPGRCQAIIWTNAGILSIGPLGINFSEILMENEIFSIKKMRLKMSSAKSILSRPQCVKMIILCGSKHIITSDSHDYVEFQTHNNDLRTWLRL